MFGWLAFYHYFILYYILYFINIVLLWLSSPYNFVIFLSLVLNDNFKFREHLESTHFQKVYVPALWLFPSTSDFSFRHLYYINESTNLWKAWAPTLWLFASSSDFSFRHLYYINESTNLWRGEGKRGLIHFEAAHIFKLI